MVVIQDKGAAGSAVANARRSLYVLARRNYHLSLLGVFDQPTMSTNCPNRQQSAVVLQSLTMLNDEFVLDEAEQVRRAASSASRRRATPRPAIGWRSASPWAATRRPRKWPGARSCWRNTRPSCAAAELAAPTRPPKRSLAHLCHMLLSSNEFLYVP